MLDVVVTLDGWSAASGQSVEGLDPTGCLWYLQDIQGWFGSGPVRTGLQDRLGADGSRGRTPLRNSRIITLTGMVIAPDDFVLAEAEERFSRILLTHVRRGDLVVDERYRGVARQAQVELNGESLFQRQGTQEAKWSLSLVAPNPEKYSTTLITRSTGRYVPGGGITFPIIFPITFAPGGTPGVIACNNTGAVETWPMFRLTGPLTNPRIRLRGGASITLIMSIETGQVVDIDPRLRTVIMSGASQRSKLSLDSKFFALPVGGSEVILDSDDGTGTLELQYRSAWI